MTSLKGAVDVAFTLIIGQKLREKKMLQIEENNFRNKCNWITKVNDISIKTKRKVKMFVMKNCFHL